MYSGKIDIRHLFCYGELCKVHVKTGVNNAGLSSLFTVISNIVQPESGVTMLVAE